MKFVAIAILALALVSNVSAADLDGFKMYIHTQDVAGKVKLGFMSGADMQDVIDAGLQVGSVLECSENNSEGATYDATSTEQAAIDFCSNLVTSVVDNVPPANQGYIVVDPEFDLSAITPQGSFGKTFSIKLVPPPATLSSASACTELSDAAKAITEGSAEAAAIPAACGDLTFGG